MSDSFTAEQAYVKSGGRLTIEQLRRAVERAEQRVRAELPGDEKQARMWLRVYRDRLSRAEAVCALP